MYIRWDLRHRTRRLTILCTFVRCRANRFLLMVNDDVDDSQAVTTDDNLRREGLATMYINKYMKVNLSLKWYNVSVGVDCHPGLLNRPLVHWTCQLTLLMLQIAQRVPSSSARSSTVAT